MTYIKQNGGVTTQDDANPAEVLLETIGSSIHDKSQNNAAEWAAKWRESPEAEAVRTAISDMREDETQWDNDMVEGAFNTSTRTQTIILTRRMLLNQWRKPAYIYSKIWVHTIQAILIGFTFFQLGTSPLDLQSR